jgi:uncharacterized protein (DUF433 family)
MIVYQQYITIDPEVRFGKAIIKGTRITVFDVLGWLAQGMSIEEILEDYPHLHREQILACLAYGSAKERNLKVVL